MTSKISIKEVAKSAGVSIATVSRVFNKSLYVSPELEKKVMNAAKELGYIPNKLASSLRMGSSRTIGFLIPDIINPFFSEIIKGAEDYLASEGYILLLTTSSNDPSKEDKLLEALYTRKVDGFCAILLGNDHPFIDRIITNNVPIVVMDNIEKHKGISYVASDNYSGMTNLMKYLIENGHKSFAFLSGKPGTFSANERLRAFKDSIKIHSLDNEILFGEYSYESGKEMVKKMSPKPDAVVCGNDMIAFGAMVELEKMGYHIPDDISITGFDDLLFSEMTYPPLTTVKQDAYMMGRTSGELLLRKIKGMDVEHRVLLNTELQIRGSSLER